MDMLTKNVHKVKGFVYLGISSDIEKMMIPIVFTCNPGVIPEITPKKIPRKIAKIISIIMLLIIILLNVLLICYDNSV